MKINSWICLAIGILFLVGMASADPFILMNSSSKEWLTANGVDTAAITVKVLNTTSGGPVSGAIVTFTVVDSTYGSFSLPSVTTDSNGNAVNTFTVKTRSGVATFTASAQYTDSTTSPATIFTSTTPLTFVQSIDHDSIYKAQYVYPLNGTVRSTVPFEAYLLDRWNNPIDSRKSSEIHNVTLHVHGPGSDNCGFVVGSLLRHDLTTTLLADGHTTVSVNLTSAPGTNTVMIDSVGSMSTQYKTIEAVANGLPYSIVGSYSPLQGTPLEPRLPASTDPANAFTIYYTLYDQYGNPTRDQGVWINTTYSDLTPENQSLRGTEYNGEVWTNYGPKNIVSDWYITATAENASSVTTTQILHFVNASPTNLELTATPQSMASLDANPAMFSELSAKVVDDFGNPVAGETVTFVLGTPQYDCTAGSCVDTAKNANGNPSFSNSGLVTTVTATTSSGAADFGVATVNVYPGSFILIGNPGYKATATGNATVTATWKGIPCNAVITWKNYPYLSAVTKITPSQVKVGDTIDINLKLNGDGWALQKKPIDVVLVNDRSGSMGSGPGSKDALAKAASKSFVDSMSTQDKVGLVSFGGGTTVNLPKTLLTDSTVVANVKTIIDSYVTGSGTPIREGIYWGTITEENTPRPGAVKALIVLTDGEWNTCGNPEGASGACSWSTPEAVAATDNVITWSHGKGIALYFIGLGVKGGTGGYNKTLGDYATAGGGKYYYAPDATKLNAIYQEIAGELQESAGADTSASLNFGNILVNGAYTTDPVFDYVGDPILPGGAVVKMPGSTMVDKYNKTVNASAAPDVFHFPPLAGYTTMGPIYRNDTDDWKASRTLSYTIGFVNLSETWETNFRLRVLKEGSYSLFGPNSCIHFKDPLTGLDTDPLCLDNQSSFTASTNPVVDPLSHQTITLTAPARTDSGGPEVVTNFPVTWDTTYSGAPGTEVKVDVYYVHDTDPRVLIRSLSYTQGSVLPYTKTLTSDFSLTSLPVGEYHYHIHAHTADASAEVDSPTVTYSKSEKNFIKLE